ncbi:hypothetical protein B0H11DRAFT_2119270 [Mycena galericulata]|nr:hypothetical protein B0H11DRAFT_2119270 [Mycena galericulata]
MIRLEHPASWRFTGGPRAFRTMLLTRLLFGQTWALDDDRGDSPRAPSFREVHRRPEGLQNDAFDPTVILTDMGT